jgi:hypothetical protein
MSAQAQHDSHLERDRLSILLAVTLVSATLFRFVELPTVHFGLRRILGSPLNFSLGGDWLLTLLMMGLVATGTFSMIQNHPLQDKRERAAFFALITPTLSALLASLLLIRATLWPIWLAGLIFSGLMIGFLVHLSYRAFSTESFGYTSARTLLNIADHLICFVLFSLILGARERALVTGPAILLVSGLLSLEFLSASGAALSAVFLFGSIIALLEAEMAWVLGYWTVSPWTAATLLVLGLYFWTGLGYQYLLNRLTRRVVMEFSILVVVMFVMTIWIRP